MNYKEVLLDYINILECNINDLCRESGLSYSLVHRYINGKRTPKLDSKYFNKIVDCLYTISKKNNKHLAKLDIYEILKTSLTY